MKRKNDMLDETDAELKCPPDAGQHQLVPQWRPGILDGLPVEILQEILLQMDLFSLTGFRRVNKRAMQVVDSIWQYQAIKKDSVAPFRDTPNYRAISHISFIHLYNTYNTPYCDDCGGFGGFIYYLTCRRTCFFCFSKKQSTWIVSTDEAR